LPLELLETFAVIAELDGNATLAAERLSHRAAEYFEAPRRSSPCNEPSRRPAWLFLKGRRWHLTTEGQRVREVVADLVRRYEQMERFVANGNDGKALLVVACGQQARVDLLKRPSNISFVNRQTAEFAFLRRAVRLALKVLLGHF